MSKDTRSACEEREVYERTRETTENGPSKPASRSNRSSPSEGTAGGESRSVDTSVKRPIGKETITDQDDSKRAKVDTIVLTD